MVAYLDADDTAIADANRNTDGHQVDLDVGPNTIKVEVTASDNTTTKTYTVIVTRSAANVDATLRALTLSDATIDPEFVYSTETYTATVDNSISRVTAMGIPNQTDATVAYLDADDMTIVDADNNTDGQQVDLDVGVNTIKVKVTATDTTTTKTYILTITRSVPDNDATLSALTLSQGFTLPEPIALDPTFGSDRESYTVSVDHRTFRITLMPTTSHADATVEYLDGDDMPIQDDDSSRTSFEAGLNSGTNTVKIKVTASDRTTTKTYTLTVTKLGRDGDTSLRSLSLSNLTLVPRYSWSLFYREAWSATASHRVSRTTIRATPGEPMATVAYLDSNDAALADADSMTAGQQVDLDVGSNTIKVKVTALDGTTTKTYTVTVTRAAASTDATLSALSLSDVTLDPTFVYSTETYTASVANSISRVTVTGTPNQTAATVAYLAGDDTAITDADINTDGHQVDLDEGANTIRVKVTATDTTTTKTYTVTVTRAAAQGTLVLNVNAIATDNVINIKEKADGFTIGGDTGTEAGVSVVVKVGSHTFDAATSAIASGATDATWSVSVPAAATYITGTSVAVDVTVSKTGFTAPAKVTRTLTIDLTAPTAPTYTAPTALKVGEAITETSPTGGTDIATYEATGLPAGLSINATSGAISGTPTTANASTAAVTVTVKDTAGNPATVDVTFPVVAKGDQTLTGFAYSSGSITLGDTAPTLTAPTGAAGTLSYSATPSTVCTVDAANGALTILTAGSCVITVTAGSTTNYNEATATFTVTVTARGTLVLNVNAIATDNVINIKEKADGFTIGGDTGTEAGVSVVVKVGSHTFDAATSAIASGATDATWSVSVPAAATYITGTSVAVDVTVSKTGFTAPAKVTRTLTIDLTAPTAPTYTAPTALKVGEAITETSPTGGTDIATYEATGLPAGLSINATSGAISGTPTTANASTAAVTVTVKDTAGNPATVDVTFPVVAKGDQTLTGFAYSSGSITLGDTAPTLTAPTGAAGTLSYSATPSTVCTVDAANGALTILTAGSCVITVTAGSTTNYNEATATFTVTVTARGTLVLNVNAIATDNVINIKEKADGFTIGGDTGTEAGVSVVVKVGSHTFDAATSAIASGATDATWSVSVPAAATYITGTSVAVDVTVSKTGFTAPAKVTRTLTIDLTAPTAPTYTAPTALKVGEAITETSPTGGTDIATYEATGLPAGLSINATSGAISGTPTTANASTAAVTVTVKDTAGNPATVDVTFPVVAKGDQTLTGFAYSSGSITLGDTAPTLTAPTGAAGTLSYSATPSTVCTVDAANGALTILTAGSCVITVTAGSTTNYNEATATFTVTVTARGTLVLNVNAIATDNVINIKEKADGFTIGGDTGTEAGVSVVVKVGSHTFAAATSAIASGATDATWSVSVPAAATYITGTSVAVDVTVSKTGFTAPAKVTRTLTIDLTAPTAPTYTAPTALKVGEAITETSPTGGTDIATYEATGLPAGLSINATSGAISGTPTTANASTAAVTVTVKDTAGNPATVDVTFPVVAKGDQTLTGFAYSSGSITLGDTAPTLTAPTGAAGTLSYSATPSTVCTVDAANGALTILTAGSCVITVTAGSTTNYNEATATFTVTVTARGTLVLNVNAIATDNVINIKEKADGFTIGGDTGTEAGVSVVVKVGSHTFDAATSAIASGATDATWSVSVPAAATYITGTSVAVDVTVSKTGFTAPAKVTRTLTIDLTAPTAPTYTAPTALKVGEAITETSPTGGTDIATYEATGLPAGLSINATSGAISGTPTTANASTAAVTVTVKDTAGNPATVDVTFPVVAKGDQTLTGFAYSSGSITLGDTAPTLTAPTGAAGTLSYSATPSTVCTVDAANGALTILTAGSCVITVTAGSTTNYNEATATFTVTVTARGTLVLNVNAIATDNVINIKEKADGFTIGGDTGTEAGVSVVVKVGSHTFDAATSAIASGATDATWSVSVPAAATYITGTSVAVDVTVSKTGFTAPAKVTRTLTIDLTAPTAPTYTAPTALKVGEAITETSPTGGTDIATYEATGLPAGLSINATSGAISGTPTTANASTAAVTVTVKDTAGNPATVDVTFPVVAKGDQTLTGFAYSSGSITLGDTAPTLTAPTGAAGTLSYSATPSTVCTVDAANGALTILTAGSCVITVTAGSTTNYNEATATFTVTVTARGTLVLNVNAIATDNVINIKEKADGFTIGGDTGTEAGVSVVVKVGSHTFDAATSAIASGATDATWSVSVPAAATYITGTSVAVDVTVSKTGFTAPAKVTRTLTIDLTAPTAPTYTAPTALKVGEAITETSPTGGTDIATYEATGLPAGLSINATSGAISGTPTTANASTAAVTVTVKDTAGNPATVDVTFPVVAKGDQTLTGFAYSSGSITLGDTAPTLTAPTGAAGTLSYSATPSTVCTVDAANGALTILTAGSCVITVTAGSTTNYNEATATFTVTVTARGTLVLNVNAIATDNVINIKEKADGFTIGGDTGTEAGVSVVVKVGSHTFDAATSAIASGATDATWSVSVPAAATYITGTSVAVDVTVSKTGFTAPAKVTRTLTIDLTAPTAPTYTAPTALKVGEAITETSPTGGTDIATYEATGLPAGLSINATSGAISGTPTTANASTAAVTVTVKDTAGNPATVDVTFPVVAKGDQTLTGFAYSSGSITLGDTAPTLTAPTGAAGTLSYSATPSTVCTVDAANGALTILTAGSCVITVTAGSTTNYNEATATFTVTVTAAVANAPAYQSGALAADGVTLTLTYDKALDATSVPGATAFTVKVNTVERGLAATNPVAVTGSTVVLKLATLARAGTAVTASYTKPGTNPIQDSDGNAAVNLTDETVTNNSAFNATGQPTITGVRRVGETLTASKGTITDAEGLTKADNGDTGYAYGYQWLRVSGATATVISGATSATYTLLAADLGKQVQVRVTFKDDADNADVLASEPYPTGTDRILTQAVCEAPTYGTGELELWNATLTLGTDGTNTYGFDTFSATSFGALQPAEFVLGSTTYTIEKVTRRTLHSQFLTTLTLDDAQPLPAGEVARLTLYDCDTSLPLSSAFGASDRISFSWTRADFSDWSTYATRTLRLSHTDAAAPTLVSHDLTGAVITLTFDEDLDPAAVPPARAFTVQVAGVDAALTRPGAVTLDGATVTLTLTAAPALTDDVTLRYAVPTSNALRDARGNAVPAFGPLQIGFEGPVLVSATANAHSLTLRYHEALDGTSVPPWRAFTVTVDGVERFVFANGGVTISGTDVNLRFAIPFARRQEVRVAYQHPSHSSTPVLRGTDGNAALEFDDYLVANETLGVPTPPIDLSATPGDSQVTLAWRAPADDGGTPVTLYQYRDVLNTQWHAVGMNLRTVVSGLENDRLYAFKVRALNAQGNGEEAGVEVRPLESDDPQLDNLHLSFKKLTLHFDERLDESAVPPISAFTVTIDGATARIVDVVVSDCDVFLTLSNEVDPGATVTVSYRPPSSGAVIRDEAGNRAAAFQREAVTNQTSHTMTLSAPATVDEGRPFTFTITRDGFFPEYAAAIVFVTDSAFPGIPGGATPGANGPGQRLLEFFAGDRSVTATMTPAFDGARPSSRTLSLRIETTDLQKPGGSRRLYRIAPADGLTPRVRDRDAGLRVADASVQEGPNAVLEFVVTLDRTLPIPTSVDYATADGTATAGQDYTATTGTLTFAAGETRQTVRVPVLDDAIDDDGETLTLTLTNSDVAIIEDGQATGTINNADPLPHAWLARFGRLAADHTIQAIDNRLNGMLPRTTQLTLNGRPVRGVFARHRHAPSPEAFPTDAGHDAGLAVDSSDQSSHPVVPTARTLDPIPTRHRDRRSGGLDRPYVPPSADRTADDAAGRMASHGEINGPLQGSDRETDAVRTSGDWRYALDSVAMAAGHNRWAMLYREAAALMRQDPREALMNSSFMYTPRADAERHDADRAGWLGDWAAWGETATTAFRGSAGPLSLTGEVATVLVGVDSSQDGWMAGLALAYSEGTSIYLHPTLPGGDLRSRLASVHPYARVDLTQRTGVWGVLGYGEGDLQLDQNNSDTALQAGLVSAMGATGIRTALMSNVGNAGRFQLAVRADARVTQSTSEAVVSLMGATGMTARVRALMEGSGELSLGAKGVLSPTVEVGLRYDDGDAERGAGLEVGLDLGYAWGALSVQTSARGLFTHEDAAYDEFGFSTTLGYQPRRDGRGLAMRVGSASGNVQSGVQSLWLGDRANGPGQYAYGSDRAQRLTAELRYGIEGRWARSMWHPFVAVDDAYAGRALRFGVNLAFGEIADMLLEIERQQNAMSHEPSLYGLQLMGSIYW